MPELPEVETVRRVLETWVLNQRIDEVEIVLDKIIKTGAEAFSDQICGKTITRIERHGKWLIFTLSTGYLISHLRMEGKYRFLPVNSYVPTSHHLVRLRFGSNYLVYDDTRRFGELHYVSDAQQFLAAKEIGPEPFQITPEALYRRVHGLNQGLKQILLDQHIMAGIGNIYADEIAFSIARRPDYPAKRLTLKEIKLLITSAQDILTRAIAAGGSSISSFTYGNEVHGHFQVDLKVHARRNQPCYQCQTLIEKIKYKGRGTYFCPRCQKGAK